MILRKKIILVFLLLIVFSTNFLAQKNPKHIKIIYPLGTEEHFIGDEIKIVWETKNVSNLNIFYFDTNFYKTNIVQGVKTNTNNFIWKIPNDTPELIRIQIEDFQDSSVNSKIPFFIHIKSQQIYKVSNNIEKSDKVSTFITKKIMPLGDSITKGVIYGSTNYDGYRRNLKIMLENNGLNFDFVGSLDNGTFEDSQHEGHSGFSAKHWTNNINYDLYGNLNNYLSLNSPDIILFHIGTNDINDYSWSKDINVANTTVSDVNSNLNLIYNFNPNIKVILAKIINRIDDTSTAALNESTTTTQFNIALENMAINRSEFGSTLFFVDMESVLNYSTDLSDKMHPNLNGYEKMSPVWYNAIINILPKLSVKVFLEGAYSGLSNMEPNENFFTSISEDQPFKLFPWYFEGTEHVEQIPANVIDWVLISLRSDETKSSTKAQRAGFIKENGTIVDVDGESPLAFVVDEGSYYVVVEHRNHLPIMSSKKVLIQP